MATMREVVDVFGRMTTLEGSPESIDTGTASLRDEVFPGVRQVDGFKGLIAFGDRSTGKMVAVTLWESEEAMIASEEIASQLRASASHAASGRIASVERFEVVFDERV